MSVLQSILDSPNMAWRRPALDDRLESNVRGLYVAGDLAGAPVVKLAMNQGFRVARQLIAELPAGSTVAVIGAGAAGLNAGFALQDAGLAVTVFEKSPKIAATFEDFPEGKWIYAEPTGLAAEGPLWIAEATKEEYLERWNRQVAERRLDVRLDEAVEKVVRRPDGSFLVKTAKGEYAADRVIVAAGQRGNPRHLQVAGEDLPHVMHRLYSPKKYENEPIVVVGGGNSAVEAALALAPRNRVLLVHRGPDFTRAFAANRRQLEQAVAQGTIRTITNARVDRFTEDSCVINGEAHACRHAFVLIGAELPTEFLKALGIQLENEWTGNPWLACGLALTTLAGLSWYGGKDPAGLALAAAAMAGLAATAVRGSRWAWLAISFLISYTIYAAKFGPEFWPFRGWGYKALSFFDRPWSFWYSALYTLIMTVFGAQAMKRWGFDRKDKFQIWRYACLVGFQVIFFFLIPEFLFQWAVKYEWVGRELARDPNFANNAWRSYGLVYAWPLFFYTFFGDPHRIWVYWGLFLTVAVIPVLVLFHGKRYCSWICGCGGLAETLGDRWRHLAPKGKAAQRWERMNLWVLIVAVIVTALMLGKDVYAVLAKPAATGIEWYRIIVDCWLVGIIPVTLYPFFGGKIWCRYWCPLAKLMEIWSGLFTRFRASRFAIVANDKCITCGECTRYCQVGIDVMNFAMKQEELNNLNSCCIGCGICVTVCPMDVLSFAERAGATGFVPLASIQKAR